MTKPTLVFIPCFSGAPWQLEQLVPLQEWPQRTMRLPDDLDDVERYADFVEGEISDLDRFVLVGDSFGAVVALACATRRPPGLEALVMSGGFAANPVTNPILKARIEAARFLPGPLYREITLRMHAASLASPHDAEGEIPWSKAASRALFVENTPHRGYVNRARAALDADYRSRLPRIDVPTLLITPSYDRLIGPQAARVMLDGIPDAEEVVLGDTGHMFRFSHPSRYAGCIRDFLESRLPLAGPGRGGQAKSPRWSQRSDESELRSRASVSGSRDPGR
jgi:pimeloyl-ACP methyl ester carboxylesterase